jgi:hypothetical protein
LLWEAARVMPGRPETHARNFPAAVADPAQGHTDLTATSLRPTA